MLIASLLCMFPLAVRLLPVVKFKSVMSLWLKTKPFNILTEFYECDISDLLV